MTVLSKELLDIQVTIECGLTVKSVRDMTKTYSEMYSTDKYSQKGPIIWWSWLNGWVFVDELSGCGVESSLRHLKMYILFSFKMQNWTLKGAIELCFRHYSCVVIIFYAAGLSKFAFSSNYFGKCCVFCLLRVFNSMSYL